MPLHAFERAETVWTSVGWPLNIGKAGRWPGASLVSDHCGPRRHRLEPAGTWANRKLRHLQTNRAAGHSPNYRRPTHNLQTAAVHDPGIWPVFRPAAEENPGNG